MQVITSNQGHTNQGHTNQGHTNQGHEVQGIQVTTPTRTHQPGTRGSRHAGNHTNQGHQPGTRGSRHAGNHTNQGHQPPRHEVQGMQVTTTNQDTSKVFKK